MRTGRRGIRAKKFQTKASGSRLLRLVMATIMVIGLSSVTPATARADTGSDLLQQFSTLKSELPTLAGLLAQARQRGIAVDYPTVDYSTISRFISIGIGAVNNGQTTEAQYIAGVLENLYTQASTEVQGYLDGTGKPLAAPHYVTGRQPLMVKGRSFIGDTRVQGEKVKTNQDVFLTGYLDGTNPDADVDIPLFQKLGNDALQFEIGPDETIFPASTPGWQPSANALQTTFARDATTAHSGAASLRVAPVPPASNGLSLVNGGLEVDANVLNGQAVLTQGTDWTDYTFSSDITIDKPGVLAGAVMVRAQDPLNGYVIDVSTNGLLGEWVEKAGQFTLLGETPAPANWNPAVTHHLSVTVAGENITPTLDGVKGVTVTDGTFPAGTIGVRAVDGQSSTRDNFVVTGADGSTLYQQDFSTADSVHDFTNATGQASGTLTERFNTVPNTTYDLSVWSKGTSAGGNVAVVVEGATNNPTSTSAQTVLPTGTYGWEKQTFSYTTAFDESSVTIAVSANGATGSRWIDDISAVPAGGSQDVIDNGGFEKAGPAGAPFVVDTTLLHTRAARILASAARNNIAVNVLLSPHDMPQFVYDETPNLGGISGGFITFDINNPTARKVLAAHIHAVMSVIKSYPSLQSVVLTNEPLYQNSASSQYTQDMWHQYLQRLYPSVAAMNATWGTSYASFDAVPASDGTYQATPYFYDWVQFNDHMFANWHAWMERQVHRVDRTVPVQIKAPLWATPFDTLSGGDGQAQLGWGDDPELFDQLSQISGDDDMAELPQGTAGYVAEDEAYQLQSSMTDAPVYDSEDHITPDGDTDFEPAQAASARLTQWLGAIHGRSGSTVWLWAEAFNSQLIRPDVVDAIGRTGLDLNRLANQVTAFQNTAPKVGILYSIAADLYTPGNGYVNATTAAYQALLYDGQNPGFVAEDQAAHGALNKYKVLVLPDTTNVDPATLTAIQTFENDGGKVVTIGTNLLAADEHNKPLDAATRQAVLNGVAQQFDASASADTMRTALLGDMQQWGDQEVTLVDADTSQAATGIEYETATYQGHLLVNIANLDKADTRHVYVEVDGKRLTAPVADLLSGANVSTGPVTLGPLSPVLLELPASAVPPVGLVAPSTATQLARGQSVPVTLTMVNNTRRRVSGTVSLTAPDGLAVSPATRSVNIAPEGVGAAAFTVTAPEASDAGPVTLTATAHLGSQVQVAAATTTVKVVNPLDASTPPLDLVAGHPSTVTLSVTNNLAAATTATVQLSAPDGWTVQPASSNVSLTAGQSQTVAVTVTPPAGLLGTPTLQAVIDGAGTTSTDDIATSVSKPVAFVGTQDDSQDEFALSPNLWANYPSAFPDDVSFTFGTSNPATDWSYVQPGPSDAWAGSRAHTFTFNFNLDQAPSTDLSFSAWLIDTNPFFAPTLQVGLNGGSLPAVTLPAGGGDGIHLGDGQPNQFSGEKPTTFQVTLPAGDLHAGTNTITLDDAAGSWLVYDAFGVIQRP